MLAWGVWMCTLLQKVPSALTHLHIFLRKRAAMRSSPNFGSLLTYPWYMRWYKTGFFSLNSANSFSLSSCKWRTQKETIIQWSVSCHYGSHNALCRSLSFPWSAQKTGGKRRRESRTLVSAVQLKHPCLC